MALLYIDSFDHYTDTEIAKYKWSDGPALNVRSGMGVQYGRRGSQGLMLNDNAQVIAGFKKSTELYMGVAVYFDSDFPNGIIHGPCHSRGMTPYVAVTTAGAMQVTRPDYGGAEVLAQSDGGVIQPRTWYYVESYWKLGDAPNGKVITKVNGLTVMENLACDTRATDTIGSFYGWWVGAALGGDGSSWKWFDDWYVLDPTGTRCNSWLGDIRIDCIYPDGPGDSTQWTPSAGPNWDTLNEHSPGLTDYVESVTNGHKDLYNYDDTGFPPGTIIHGLQLLNLSRKEEDGNRIIRNVIKSGATEIESPDWAPMRLTYRYNRTPSDTDPSTNAAWTVATVDAIQAGVKVIA